MVGETRAARVVQVTRMLTRLMPGSLLPLIRGSPDPVAHVDNRRQPRAAGAARSTRAHDIP
ncbi:UNVERIFIED_ORG: hypothetical protein CLV66_106237 [Actinomadura viridilutea]